MLMNIMYYGMNNSTSQQQDGLKIGSYINLTLEQLSIGIITNLIVFPPTLLLVQLFRRIKPRNSRLSKLKQVLKCMNGWEAVQMKYPLIHSALFVGAFNHRYQVWLILD